MKNCHYKGKLKFGVKLEGDGGGGGVGGWWGGGGVVGWWGG